LRGEGSRAAAEGNSMMQAYLLMRIGAQALSAILGGVAVFCLWKSFYVPQSALYAILFLPTATGIVIALQEKPQPSRRR
jgi:hypothetical protein